MKPKSNSLFHFTKSAEFLRGILQNGIHPRYCLEDVRWLSLKGHNYLAYPMVCFCDIPLSRISEHTAFYGEYGIGLTKEWSLKNKLAPVIYTPPDSAIVRMTDFLFELKSHDVPDMKDYEKNRTRTIYEMLSLTKPLSGNMIIGGTPVEKEFYQESEWRFVPEYDTDSVHGLLFEDEFAKERDEANKEAEKSACLISPSDIKYLFVKSEHEIPELVDFINTKLGHFPLNELKILTTRILSLDGISEDL